MTATASSTLDKMARLEAGLRLPPAGAAPKSGPVAVCFSGGVDSAFLLAAAAATLGPDNVVAFTADAVVFPAIERDAAAALANRLGVRHIRLDANLLAVPGFAGNPADRCYVCKKALFGMILEQARRLGVGRIFDGANADDKHDYRPGMRATAELGVESPLAEAGLSKRDVRELSRLLALDTWDKPSMACLASRIPYGEAISEEKLRRIEAAEAFVRSLGCRDVRVRHHGDVARIEVGLDDIPRLAERQTAAGVNARLRELGFIHVALDLGGFRSGGMNEVLGGA